MKKLKVLFQGDSITDGGRDRNDPHVVGWGYVLYATRFLRERHPEIEFEFLNFGISGNKSDDLVGRWTTDCIEHKPDVVSVMIGVNDTWHHAGDKSWVPNEVFEANCRNILERTKNEVGAKIIMLEQYLLPSPGDKDFFREDIDPKIQVTRKLAREYADVYVPTDGLIAAQCIDHDPLYWSEDAVHPNDNLAVYIAKLYCDAFEKILRKMGKE